MFSNFYYKNTILFLIFLIPLLPLLNIIIPKFGLIKEFIIFVYLLIFMHIYRVKDLIKSINTNTLIIIVYLVYILFHFFISTVSFYSSLLGLKYHFFPFLFAYILNVIYYNEPIKLLKYFLLMILCSTIIVDIIGLIEYFSPNTIKGLYGDYLKHVNFRGIKNVRLISTLSNPINLGIFLVFSLISIYTLKKLLRSSKINFLINILIPINILLILFTLSRAAYAGLFIVVTIYVISSKKRFILTFLFLCFLALFDIIPLHYLTILLDRFSDMSFTYISTDMRFVNWYNILMSFFEKIHFLFFGMGIGNLGWTNESRLTENAYLGVFIEFGLIGLILYLTLLISFMKNIIRIIRINSLIGYYLLIFFLIFLLWAFLMDIHINLPISFYFWFLFLISNSLQKNKKVLIR